MSRVETSGDDNEARRAAMSVLAQARCEDIETALSGLVGAYRFDELRAPETGLVMLRGRIGGDGSPFNVGEATVTRAAVRLDTGETGFSYVLGRDTRKARLAALCDALWQSPSYRTAMETHVILPLCAAQAKSRSARRAQTAATRVDFFTLVRGENES
jgi:alpha-D-ribose 1-methylphosphonate 5-triphosphate synthase subunit PhnG